MVNTPIKTLKDILRWIIETYEENPATWTQGVFARDRYGIPVSWNSTLACSWDVYGMIQRAMERFDNCSLASMEFDILFGEVLHTPLPEIVMHTLSMVYSYQETVNFLKKSLKYLDTINPALLQLQGMV